MNRKTKLLIILGVAVIALAVLIWVLVSPGASPYTTATVQDTYQAFSAARGGINQFITATLPSGEGVEVLLPAGEEMASAAEAHIGGKVSLEEKEGEWTFVEFAK